MPTPIEGCDYCQIIALETTKYRAIPLPTSHCIKCTITLTHAEFTLHMHKTASVNITGSDNFSTFNHRIVIYTARFLGLEVWESVAELPQGYYKISCRVTMQLLLSDSNLRFSTGTHLGTYRLLLQEPVSSPKINFVVQGSNFQKYCTRRKAYSQSCANLIGFLHM